MLPLAALKEGLGKHKIMGINARNLDFILPNNARRNYPLVDDKLLTKQLAQKAGIPVPELYGVVEFIHDAARVAEIAAPHKQFAIKPCRGSGGGGIVVVKNVFGGSFQKVSGEIVSAADMQYHVTNMLSGMYSLKSQADKVILEYAVKFDPIFDEITYQGVPDIRIICYKGVPVMAMLRLPTRKSDGKANLHKGGIGVGVRMHDGVTMYGVQSNSFINEHPETLHKLAGRTIPNWPQLLEMAAKFYDIVGLGYVGVDIVLDRDKGPMVLEANARPGIAIQIANRRGLLSRTEKVDAIDVSKFSMADRIDFALNAYKGEFGNEFPV
jgi:alpha-L-glutamate ligase-like protein